MALLAFSGTGGEVSYDQQANTCPAWAADPPKIKLKKQKSQCQIVKKGCEGKTWRLAGAHVDKSAITAEIFGLTQVQLHRVQDRPMQSPP